MKRLLLLVSLSLFAVDVDAQVSRSVENTRIRISDVIPEAPVAMADVELGQAPAPGASRLVGSNEVEGALLRAGHSLKGLRIPRSVRVVSPARRITTTELEGLASPIVRKELPAGVTLKKVAPTGPLVTPRKIAIGHISVPKLPRQKGEVRTTAMMELVSDGVIFSRIPLPLVVDISEEAAKPDVARGTNVSLLVEQKNLQIRAIGIALSEGSAGDVIQVRVQATGRLVRARVRGPGDVTLVEG